MSATVAWISIAPIKGMRMQDMSEVELTADGIIGDREFFLADSNNDMVSATRLGPLLEIVPDYDQPRNRLTLNFPDDLVIAEEIELGEPEAVAFYGQDFQARPVQGGFSEAISQHAGVELKLMARPEDRPGVDRGSWGAATLLGLASIERLEEAAAAGDQPGDIDQRRFRMSFGVDGIEAHEEDRWVGGSVMVGETEVFVQDLVGRCAATTRDPDRGNVDLKTLHHIKAYRGDIESNEPLPFGVYAGVKQPGTVRTGDPVVPVETAS